MINIQKIKLYIQSQSGPPIYISGQKASGKGLPSKNDLNSTSDLSGCENGASWDAPLMVAKESILP